MPHPAFLRAKSHPSPLIFYHPAPSPTVASPQPPYPLLVVPYERNNGTGKPTAALYLNYTYLPTRPRVWAVLRHLPSCDDVLLERCSPERHTSKSTERNLPCREAVSQSQNKNLSIHILSAAPTTPPSFPSIPYCVAHLHCKLNKVRCPGTGDSTCPRAHLHLPPCPFSSKPPFAPWIIHATQSLSVSTQVTDCAPSTV